MSYSALASERVSNRMFIRLIILALFLLPNTVFAQSPKIAIVDIEKLSSQSLAGQSIQKQLKDRRSAFQKEFSAREDNLMNAEKLLIEDKNNLTNDEFTKRRKEFETQLLETRNLFQKRRNALDKGVGEALSQLRKTIVEVTAQIADQEDYNIVLTRESVVIVETEMDITEKVMAAMNAKLPNIPLTIEE
jgi:outer membrane protein